MNPSPRTTVPDLLLERYRLGELSAAESAALRERIAADPALAARLAALDASDAEVRERYPAVEMARMIRARASVEGARAPRLARRALWLAPAAALILVAVALAPLVGRLRPAPVDGVKGPGPTLVVHRKTPTGSELLETGAAARKGDLLRVGYRAAGRRFGVIVSVDGRGTVTQHLPPGGEKAEALAQGETALLPFAFELDDAPSWERFYLVTSDAPFDVAPVRSAAAAAARVPGPGKPPALALPAGLSQTAFALRKESR